MERTWRLAGRFRAEAPKCLILGTTIYLFDQLELDMVCFELCEDGAV